MKSAGNATGTCARGGFTLVELMAVMIILAILMVFLLPRLTGMAETVQGKATQSFVSGSLSVAIQSYESETGEYPPSAWDDERGAAPNASNLGSEMLYLALWSERMQGMNISDDHLGNTDGDRTRKALTVFGSNDLFEVCDGWENPIAYFRRRDYGRKDVYVTVNNETGQIEETVVEARMNPRTKSYYQFRTFQLISAGPDGAFNTDDDITNFSEK